MIDYHTFHQIKYLHSHEKLSIGQIAKLLNLSVPTVYKYLKQERFEGRKSTTRKRLIDGYIPIIQNLLNRHPDYRATQIFHLIKEQGYKGGYSSVKELVRTLRPGKKPAYLTLGFEPGCYAQVDFGYCGKITIGNTTRRLSIFVMVLCYSRMMFAEFILRESLEHFLSCHRKAFEYFGGVPEHVMVDNCKVAVTSVSRYQEPVPNPHYMDLAKHYAFTIRPCGVRKPHEKGRVESAINYIRQSFLNHLELTNLSALNHALAQWLDTVANVRNHATTRERPCDRFKKEKDLLSALPVIPYDCCRIKTVRSNKQFRIHFDANTYSVPSDFASQILTLRVYPEKLSIYHQQALIAEHSRSYERNKDIEHPDHPKELIHQRKKARHQKQFRDFLALCPQAEAFYQGLQQRRVNPRCHLRKILALVEIYGASSVAQALEDALEMTAFSCEYIANILEHRQRLCPPHESLHVTRNQEVLDLSITPPNLDIYNTKTNNDEEDDDLCQPIQKN